MNVLTQQEKASVALKTAVQYEQMIAAKYTDLAKSITDPAIQKHLQSLEQTARNLKLTDAANANTEHSMRKGKNDLYEYAGKVTRYP